MALVRLEVQAMAEVDQGILAGSEELEALNSRVLSHWSQNLAADRDRLEMRMSYSTRFWRYRFERSNHARLFQTGGFESPSRKRMREASLTVAVLDIRYGS